MMKKTGSLLIIAVIFICTVFLPGGCGYTTASLLPTQYKTIYVETFSNKIQVTAEQSNVRMYRGYRPGLEIDVTRAIIDKYMMDGNLNIGKSERSDLLLKGELTDYKKEALRYDTNNNIEEFRLRLVVNIEVYDRAQNKRLWAETGFSGETTYRTAGSLTKPENVADQDAIDDLARRIVERTIEGW